MRPEMPQFQPKDPGYAARVRASFGLQQAMQLIGAELAIVEPGYTEIHLPFKAEISQQHGYIHGGVVGMIADSAAGYAANTLTPADTSVLTVEYKLNLVAPADGQRLVARGEVIKPGRTLIITRAEVFAIRDEQWTLCAIMQQTIMAMQGKSERSG
ncbi:PaaI family thioesterase [Thauera mechernichensis]|uniref:Medium/long-chain acyl-CoA thioesterase YigI n=1 Tax=Thauera mechernichensis TaxID=82788 RepID=A0ABW3WBP9_9RHOO|nr:MULTISPECIES: PaaI family thioesterase [Thauera]MDG3064241.1 PaaI family thioesterase [Thauera mechernichensis]WBL63823.1 PaaI family thioesterase [Thauera sp. WB-2]HNR60520.1 PaaI family thioesterase [Thauera sp.]HNS93899.1 PaaI family thioesterase [Thauera sp.]HRJ22948.1 PaaI family thioesterase [Thauera sp.]